MLKITRECLINEHDFPYSDKSSKCLKCPSINVVNNAINPIIENYEIIKKWGRYDGRHTAGLIKMNEEILFFIHLDDDKYIWDSIEDFVFALPYHLYRVYRINSEQYESFFEGKLYFNEIENKEFIGYITEQLDEIFLKEWYCYYDWSLSQQVENRNIYIWDYDEFENWIEWYEKEPDMEERFASLDKKSKVIIEKEETNVIG